ncbi:MAG: hypothetical protein IH872_11315 [Chloroflexi bacterium]|nr:hypothetical protein [Chloroflexota bacterium]
MAPLKQSPHLLIDTRHCGDSRILLNSPNESAAPEVPISTGEIDQDKAGAFEDKMVGVLNDSILGLMTSIGH